MTVPSPAPGTRCLDPRPGRYTSKCPVGSGYSRVKTTCRSAPVDHDPESGGVPVVGRKLIAIRTDDRPLC